MITHFKTLITKYYHKETSYIYINILIKTLFPFLNQSLSTSSLSLLILNKLLLTRKFALLLLNLQNSSKYLIHFLNMIRVLLIILFTLLVGVYDDGVTINLSNFNSLRSNFIPKNRALFEYNLKTLLILHQIGIKLFRSEHYFRSF